MLTHKRLIRIAVVASVACLGLTPPANAAPQTQTPHDQTCSDVAVGTGACLTSIVIGDIDPTVAAVSQALLRGETAKAHYFVAQRGRTRADALQTTLEKLLRTPPERLPVVSVPPPAPRAVTSLSNTTKGYPTYLWCGSSGCSEIGKSLLEIRTYLDEYPTVSMSGDFEVVRGPRVDITKLECLARYDRNNLPDSTVHTWQNCNNAAVGGFTWRVPIDTERWHQGGTNGAKYYNEARITLKIETRGYPTAGPMNMQTPRWTIPAHGGQPTFP
ncbi:hypothetical protein ACXJJ3_30590 [Kribbella sp. WER1]